MQIPDQRGQSSADQAIVVTTAVAAVLATVVAAWCTEGLHGLVGIAIAA